MLHEPSVFKFERFVSASSRVKHGEDGGVIVAQHGEVVDRCVGVRCAPLRIA